MNLIASFVLVLMVTRRARQGQLGAVLAGPGLKAVTNAPNRNIKINTARIEKAKQERYHRQVVYYVWKPNHGKVVMSCQAAAA